MLRISGIVAYTIYVSYKCEKRNLRLIRGRSNFRHIFLQMAFCQIGPDFPYVCSLSRRFFAVVDEKSFFFIPTASSLFIFMKISIEFYVIEFEACVYVLFRVLFSRYFF